MARAITKDIEAELIKIGTTKRFAARLGALARARLFISDVVLELLSEGDDAKPLTQFLFTPALLEGASTLHAEAFKELCSIHARDSYFEMNPLQLIVAGDVRCIALADESPTIENADATQSSEPAQQATQAQPNEQAPPATLEAEPAQSVHALIKTVREQGSPVLSKQETEALFSGDQMAEIKLVLLTSTNPDLKVESLRQLFLSPINADAKARLFITALRDESTRVRSEAAKGLGSLGMDSRVTENLARAASGELDERLVSLSNIAHFFETLDESEQALCVAVLSGMISARDDQRVIGETISVLTQILPRFALTQPAAIHETHTRLQEVLQVKRADLLPAARKLYRALMKEAPDLIAGMLQKSLDEVAPIFLRSFYLSLIAVSGTAVAHERKTAELLIEAMIETDEFDPSYIPLNTALQEIGLRVLDVLLDVMRETSEVKQARLLGMIGDISRSQDLNLEQRDAIASTLLDVFDAGESDLRVQIYESGILRTNEFSSELRARATKLMLDDMHEHELESGRELVGSSILQLGGAAFPELFQRITSATHDSTGVEACNLLGALTDRWRDDPIIAERVPASIDSLLELSTQEDLSDRGAIYRTLGKLGSHAAATQPQVATLIEMFSDKLGTTSATYDIIEALGWLASGDSVDEATRLELCHTLLGFLSAKLPAMSASVRDHADESVLHFGRETTAYVDMIPRLIEAFDRILMRHDLAQGLWRRIVDVLADRFGKAARYEVVWAPASVLMLARTLGKAATSERSQGALREELVELLLIKSNMVAIMQELAAVAMSDGSPRMNVLALDVLDRLEKNLHAEESMDPQEHRAVLRSLSRLLERELIGTNEASDRRARQRILDLLYAALKDRVRGASDVLKEMVRSGKARNIPLDDIRRRLEKIGVRFGGEAKA